MLHVTWYIACYCKVKPAYLYFCFALLHTRTTELIELCYQPSVGYIVDFEFVHHLNPHFCLFLQKFTMAGTSQFVPSLNAITSNQDLQWLVQPSLVPPPGPSRSPRPPYPSISGLRPLSHSPSLFRPGVIRAAANPGGSTRRRNDEHVRKWYLDYRL